MAKRITVGEAEIESLRKDFEKALTTAKAAGGKFKFEADLGTVKQKAKVVFDEDVFVKMKLLIATSSKEVGWHCLARKVEPDDGYANQYEVYDIMVYPQTVTGATVTTDKTEFETWLYQRPDDEFDNIRFHGHSHVNMGTSPSSVDTTMYKEWLDDLQTGIPNQFYIFSIWNKSGDHWMNIYDLDDNVLYETKDIDVKFLCEEGGIMDFVSEAGEMVKEKAPTYTPPAKTYTSYTKTSGVTHMDNAGYPTYDDSYYGYGRSYGGNYYGGRNFPDWDD